VASQITAGVVGQFWECHCVPKMYSMFMVDYLLCHHKAFWIIKPGVSLVLLHVFFSHVTGRAIAQVVSCWLPTVPTQVRTRVRSCGICSGRSGTGAGLLGVLQFPLPIFIPLIAPQSPSSIIWGCYSRPVVVTVPSGLSLTPLKIMMIIVT
jgi:hypothetical protein